MQTTFEQHSSLRFGINCYLQIKVHKKSENQIQSQNTQQMSNVIELDELH